MKALTAVFLAFCLTSLAFAQSRPFLSKAEVETLASGKAWTFRENNVAMQWNLAAGGYLSGGAMMNPEARGRGTWLVNDKAQLCVKFLRVGTDRCVAVLKDGEKLTMVDSNDMAGEFSEFTVK